MGRHWCLQRQSSLHSWALWWVPWRPTACDTKDLSSQQFSWLYSKSWLKFVLLHGQPAITALSYRLVPSLVSTLSKKRCAQGSWDCQTPRWLKVPTGSVCECLFAWLGSTRENNVCHTLSESLESALDTLDTFSLCLQLLSPSSRGIRTECCTVTLFLCLYKPNMIGTSMFLKKL